MVMKRKRPEPVLSAFAARKLAADNVLTQPPAASDDDLSDAASIASVEPDVKVPDLPLVQPDPAHLPELAQRRTTYKARVVRKNGETILGLLAGEQTSLCARCYLRVLQGEITILGARLSPTEEWHTLAVPSYHSQAVILSVSQDVITQNYFTDPITALIAFKAISDDVLEIVRSIPQLKNTFPPGVGLPAFSEVDEKSLTLPDSWRTICDQGPRRCNIIVGGKNSGKSTLSRHLINASLNTSTPVSFLDLDPGQTEFSPPGMISLYRLDKCLLYAGPFGPPLDGLHHWLGETSSKEDPSHYLACISDLIHRTALEDAPLIVNTPGWIKGTGMELLIAIINMLDASLTQDLQVLHLGRSALLQNLPQHIPCQELDQQNSQNNSNAADLRTASLMMYFHRRDQTWSKVLNDGDYWHLSFEQGKGAIAGIAIMREEVGDKDILAALSGTIVALICIRDFETSGLEITYEQTGIGIIQNAGEPMDPRSSTCIGLAIIAHINLSDQTLSLITPIPQSTFQSLEDTGDTLILSTGSIEIPIGALTSNTTLPYPRPHLTDSPGTGIGWQSWHVRRNIGRRRL